MAKQSSAQMIGRRGQRWFESQLPHNWLVQEPRNNDDASIDYTITVADGSKMSGLHFRVQVRTKLRTTVTDGHVTLGNVKRSALLDWLIGTTPTLLVLYDCERNCGYCEWANLLINKDFELVFGKSKTTTVRVPTIKCLPEAWETIRDELVALHGMLIDTMQFSMLQHIVLFAIVQVTLAYQAVAFTYVVEPKADDRTEKQSTLLVKLEGDAHRGAVRTAIWLVKRLTEMGVATDGLGDWIENYKAACRTFITKFDEAVETHGPTDVTISKSVMNERRSELLFRLVTLIETMVELTIPHLPAGYTTFLKQRPYVLVSLPDEFKVKASHS